MLSPWLWVNSRCVNGRLVAGKLVVWCNRLDRKLWSSTAEQSIGLRMIHCCGVSIQQSIVTLTGSKCTRVWAYGELIHHDGSVVGSGCNKKIALEASDVFAWGIFRVILSCKSPIYDVKRPGRTFRLPYSSKTYYVRSSSDETGVYGTLGAQCANPYCKHHIDRDSHRHRHCFLFFN